MQPAAEVTGVIAVVASGTQGRKLSVSPIVRGDTISGVAVIAETPGNAAAVNARPRMHIHSKHFHGEIAHLNHFTLNCHG